MSRALAVKLTSGAEAAERANQALTVAAAAAVGGAEVSVWFTGDAVWFGVEGREPDLGLPGATPAADLLTALRESGADLVVCSQCAARREITDEHLALGVRIAGAAAFAELVLRDDVQALIY